MKLTDYRFKNSCFSKSLIHLLQVRIFIRINKNILKLSVFNEGKSLVNRCQAIQNKTPKILFRSYLSTKFGNLLPPGHLQ